MNGVVRCASLGAWPVISVPRLGRRRTRRGTGRSRAALRAGRARRWAPKGVWQKKVKVDPRGWEGEHEQSIENDRLLFASHRFALWVAAPVAVGALAFGIGLLKYKVGSNEPIGSSVLVSLGWAALVGFLSFAGVFVSWLRQRSRTDAK